VEFFKENYLVQPLMDEGIIPPGILNLCSRPFKAMCFLFVNNQKFNSKTKFLLKFHVVIVLILIRLRTIKKFCFHINVNRVRSLLEQYHVTLYFR